LSPDWTFCPAPPPGGNPHDTQPTEYCDGFSSMHNKIVNGVMCDGSVHSFSVFIDYQLFNYMGSKADGQAIVVPAD
jgi:hypothetical protein